MPPGHPKAAEEVQADAGLIGMRIEAAAAEGDIIDTRAEVRRDQGGDFLHPCAESARRVFDRRLISFDALPDAICAPIGVLSGLLEELTVGRVRIGHLKLTQDCCPRVTIGVVREDEAEVGQSPEWLAQRHGHFAETRWPHCRY